MPPEEIAHILGQGDILAYEGMPSGSNYAFLVLISAGAERQLLGVYKPQRGERPLWDFPRGSLFRREHAAYVASTHLGWPNIPVTVIRDGPFGPGSVQLYIPTADDASLFSFGRRKREELARIALFDLLVNNADRKAGHCLLGVDGRVWAIDHGLTFHVEPKLRTVLWDFCEQPIPKRLLYDLAKLREDGQRRDRLRSQLSVDLAADEVEGFFRRLDRILSAGRYPRLDPQRNVPWPLI